MIKTIKRLIASVSVLGLLIAPAVAMAAPVAVYAAGADDCGGIQTCLGGGVTATDPNSTSDQLNANERVTGIAQTVIKIFSWVVGIISVIMVIVGGFQYVTSGGDSGKVTTAKNTIMYALIGIVIVALSQLMVNYVLAKALAN